MQEMEEKFREKIENFLISYITNSPYAINGLMRHHSKEELLKGTLKDSHFGESNKTYAKINKEYILNIMAVAFKFAINNGLSLPTVLYRGCNDIDVDGFTGLVSTTKDYSFAEYFDRGTILKIHLPAGTSFIDVNREIYLGGGDNEEEVILPPCSYRILSEKLVDSDNPNNPNGKTKIIDVEIKQKNFLREFFRAAQNPPEDYFIEHSTDDDKNEMWQALNNLCMAQMATIINMAFTKDRNYIDDYLIAKDEFLKGTRSFTNEKTDILKNFESLKSNNSLPEATEKHIGKCCDESKQIDADAFYAYIKNSKHFNILNEYLTSDDHVVYYKDNTDGFHDVRHADNATLFAYYIASKMDLDEVSIRLVLEAARYHDCGRTSTPLKYVHARVGGELYCKMTEKVLPHYESKLVSTLIEAHSFPSKEEVAYLILGNIPILNEIDLKNFATLAQIVRDSDVLDHVNAGFFYGDFDQDMLELPAAQELVKVSATLNYKQDKIKENNNKGKS